MRSFSHRVIFFLIPAFACIFITTNVGAQSSSVDLPTPVTSSELFGTIKARDIGDSRPTTYYYWFEGTTGDIFVNLVTKNFAGDIDIFVQSGLKSLTKIVVYPEFGEIETGRVLYLRKPEKLLLRVQGRSPNDDPAQFRLKFGGSFVAATDSRGDLPENPKVTDIEKGRVAVNSVGTRIPPKEVPVAEKDETPKTEEVSTEKEKVVADEIRKDDSTDKEKTESDDKKEIPKFELVVTDETKPAATVKKPPVTRSSRRRQSSARPPVKKTVTEKVKPPDDAEPKKVATENVQTEEEENVVPLKKSAKADPLANVQLVIVFKDGKKIERPLPEVFRFSVDRGVLTVVSKTGRVGKYQMVDVLKVTIE